MFDTEYAEAEAAAAAANEDEEASSKAARAVVKKDGGNLYGLTNGEFYFNLCLMALLFTMFSFSFWLGMF